MILVEYEKMKRLTSCTILLLLATTPTVPQSPAQGSRKSPRDIVEQLWRLATAGEVLTTEGWGRVAGFFEHPAPYPGNNVVYIISNSFGPADQRMLKENTAEVIRVFEPAGQIDAAMRYTPPQDTRAIKTGTLYHLAYLQTHWPMYKPDGKTLDREMPGPMEWQIEDAPGPPFTTVNTAIRYVLETRAKTADPDRAFGHRQHLAKTLIIHANRHQQ